MNNVIPSRSRTLERDWWVVSTVIQECALLVECANTGAVGLVYDPTLEEWRAAFHAPSKPYKWTDHDRVWIDPDSEQAAGHA